MGDDEHGAAGHEPVEGVGDGGLAGLVLVRGGLVEHEQRCVAQEGPGDGDALALAAGEARAGLPHGRLEALGQALDELGRRWRRAAASATTASSEASGPGQADVVGDRAVEEVRALRHPGQRGAPGGASECSDSGRPSTAMSPASGSMKRSSRLAMVDLPAPLAPTSATDSPGRSSSETPSSAGASRAG